MTVLAVVMALVVVASVSVGVAGVAATEPGDGEQVAAQAQPLDGADATVAGASANDSFGRSLAHGDVNGDGAADLVVGAPLNDTANGNNSGAVYVFYGPVDERGLDASAADVTLLGADNGDWAGYDVAAGNVNGDGADDLVVGAPLEDAAGNASGSAYVVYGGDLPSQISLSNTTRDGTHQFVGAAAGDRAGISVATVPRQEADQVLVGAPFNDAAGQDAGAAFLLDDAEGDVQPLTDAAALTGEAANDRAGFSVASAGDFDGDGSTDLAVGAPKNNSTAWNAGAAYVVTGGVSGTASLSDAQVKFAGQFNRDNAGWALASGDVNGDGAADLVVGAPFADPAGPRSGVAYVAYGGDGSGTVNLSAAGTTLAGSESDEVAGISVAASDVNGDGAADVVVGAPGRASDAGATYVVAGGENPPRRANLSTAAATLAGEADGDRAGFVVSVGADVTGDGTVDVFVGAPSSDAGAQNAGRVYVV